MMKEDSKICFWEDKWLENVIFREQYPTMYRIVRDKYDTLARVLNSSPPELPFRGFLSALVLCHDIIFRSRLDSINLMQRGYCYGP